MFGSKKTESEPMLVVTIPDLPGRSYDVIGLVVSETKNVTATGGFDLQRVLDAIEPEARKLGADAVIGAQVVAFPLQGLFKYAVFGTAIKFHD